MPGVDFPKEHADGHAAGVVYVPNSIEPVNRTRSYSKLGHYDSGGVSARKNFHLLPAYRVTQLLMEETTDSESSKWAASGIRIAPRDSSRNVTLSNETITVKARREIILSAGTVHTPQVLQRSGLGPREVLEAAGVGVKVELPGVGANLQDHLSYSVSFRCKYSVTNSSECRDS
jgi:choline dehydrogenase-like flavoprotein